jgi:dimethylhistidine N-methyltransferase
MTVKTEDLTRIDILDEVLEGLTSIQKYLPSKLFYDEKGSELFEKITSVEEYYLTRTEISIMTKYISEISNLLGEGTLLVELGSGSSKKIRLLLDNIPGLAGYVPVDISAEHLFQSCDLLKTDYPDLDIYPVAADYTKDFNLPEINKTYDHKAVFFPGSTIGNFSPDEAKIFLEHVSKICGKNGGLIIGVDLLKDRKTLEKAYNDSNAITSEFNLNILRHLNEELNTDFDLNKFKHIAEGRIEMHLISKETQQVHLNGTTIGFKKGENIRTEYSYKYSLEGFAELASPYFEVRKVWTDEDQLFSIQYLRVK